MAPAYKPAGLTALMLGDIPALFESPFAKEITQPFEGKHSCAYFREARYILIRSFP
jgi:hypothetical protein